MWHSQLTGVTLRLYDSDDPQGAFERREPFVAMAQAVMLGQGRAFLHSAMNKDGKPLSMATWMEIGTLLKEKYGILEVMMERHGRLITLSTNKC